MSEIDAMLKRMMQRENSEAGTASESGSVNHGPSMVSTNTSTRALAGQPDNPKVVQILGFREFVKQDKIIQAAKEIALVLLSSNFLQNDFTTMYA